MAQALRRHPRANGLWEGVVGGNPRRESKKCWKSKQSKETDNTWGGLIRKLDIRTDDSSQQTFHPKRRTGVRETKAW